MEGLLDEIKSEGDNLLFVRLDLEQSWRIVIELFNFGEVEVDQSGASFFSSIPSRISSTA